MKVLLNCSSLEINIGVNFNFNDLTTSNGFFDFFNKLILADKIIIYHPDNFIERFKRLNDEEKFVLYNILELFTNKHSEDTTNTYYKYLGEFKGKTKIYLMRYPNQKEILNEYLENYEVAEFYSSSILEDQLGINSEEFTVYNIK